MQKASLILILPFVSGEGLRNANPNPLPKHAPLKAKHEDVANADAAYEVAANGSPPG